MTLKEFFDGLRTIKEAGFETYILTHGEIRLAAPDGTWGYCPITALCVLKTGDAFASRVESVKKLDLEGKAARRIARASDFEFGCSVVIYDRILDALDFRDVEE